MSEVRDTVQPPGKAPELAVLTFDSALDDFQGTRSAVLTESRRQFVWTSSDIDVALTMWNDAYAVHAICVDGQVLPHELVHVTYTISLMIEGVEVARTVGDIDGCFAFEGLDHGDYEFRIDSLEHSVVAGPIPVR